MSYLPTPMMNCRRTREHTVNIQKLTEVLEFKSKNDKYLKESLKGLMQIIVEWNLLGKDGQNQWGANSNACICGNKRWGMYLRL